MTLSSSFNLSINEEGIKPHTLTEWLVLFHVPMVQLHMVCVHGLLMSVITICFFMRAGVQTVIVADHSQLFHKHESAVKFENVTALLLSLLLMQLFLLCIASCL